MDEPMCYQQLGQSIIYLVLEEEIESLKTLIMYIIQD
jgi:hypothetical protein